MALPRLTNYVDENITTLYFYNSALALLGAFGYACEDLGVEMEGLVETPGNDCFANSSFGKIPDRYTASYLLVAILQ